MELDLRLGTGLREEVWGFAQAMEAKLRAKDHKNHWRTQPVEAHIKFLEIEMMEFKTALEFLTFDDACKELVDIANFAMIIRDKIMKQGRAAFRGPPMVVVPGGFDPGSDALRPGHVEFKAGEIVPIDDPRLQHDQSTPDPHEQCSACLRPRHEHPLLFCPGFKP